MKKEKLALPLAIVITGIALGICFIVVQTIKTNERELQKQEEAKTELLKIKQKECSDMLTGLKANWYNIIGIKYSEFLGECEVTFYDVEDGDKVTTAPLSAMETVK